MQSRRGCSSSLTPLITTPSSSMIPGWHCQTPRRDGPVKGSATRTWDDSHSANRTEKCLRPKTPGYRGGSHIVPKNWNMFEAKSGLPWRFPHSVCRWPLHYMPVFWLCLWPTSLSENVHKQLLRVGTDLSVLTEILSCKCNIWRFQEWTTRCLPGQLVPFAATTAIKMSCGTFHHAIRPSRCLPGQLIPFASAYLCTESLCISLHPLPVHTFVLSASAYLCTTCQCIFLHFTLQGNLSTQDYSLQSPV